ncbi:MAG: hypothetical protein WBC83_03400 [Minisyncoccia bacterium]
MNKKILFALVSLGVLGVIFLVQREEWGSLPLSEQSSSLTPSQSSLPVVSNNEKVTSTRNGLVESSFHLFGKVKEIGVGYLVVEASVADFEKLDAVDFSGEKTELPAVLKNYRVNISDRTEFTSVGLNEIYDNAYITVESREGIYTTNELTAIKVTVPPIEELSIIAEKNKKISEAIANGTYQVE